MLSKFLRRPASIELICQNQFGKMFTTSGVKLNKTDTKNDTEENESKEADSGIGESPDDIDNSKYDINKQKFHYIITETDKMVTLPKLIEISEPYPGEPKWMRKRKGPAVIRYHKVKRDT